MRVDHRQRFVEHDDVHVVPDEAPAHGDLLLVVGAEVGRADRQHVGHLEHFGDLGHACVDPGRVDAAVLERERQVFADRHGVVDHRELEHLRDVAVCRFEAGHVLVVKEDAAFGRGQEARDDVQKRGLAAARGPQKRVGPAIAPGDVDLFQRKVFRPLRVGKVAVAEVGERDACHLMPPAFRPCRSTGSERGSCRRCDLRRRCRGGRRRRGTPMLPPPSGSGRLNRSPKAR